MRDICSVAYLCHQAKDPVLVPMLTRVQVLVRDCSRTRCWAFIFVHSFGRPLAFASVRSSLVAIAKTRFCHHQPIPRFSPLCPALLDKASSAMCSESSESALSARSVRRRNSPVERHDNEDGGKVDKWKGPTKYISQSLHHPAPCVLISYAALSYICECHMILFSCLFHISPRSS